MEQTKTPETDAMALSVSRTACSEFSLSAFYDIKRKIEYEEIKAKRAAKRALHHWRECRRKTKIIQQVRKEITQ